MSDKVCYRCGAALEEGPIATRYLENGKQKVAFCRKCKSAMDDLVGGSMCREEIYLNGRRIVARD